jgi:hypothetical protein
MLHTYDAQMLDYPSDIDVPMHSSSETWFLGDLPMEDDLHDAHVNKPPLTSPAGVSVEVDMEDWAGESIEYEMADEDEQTGGGDLVDVEVYDVSQVPTPLALDGIRALPEAVSDDLYLSPSYPPNVIVSMVPEDDNFHAVDGQHDNDYINHPDSTPYDSIQEQPVVLSPSIEPLLEVSDDASVTTAVIRESTPPLPPSSPHHVQPVDASKPIPESTSLTDIPDDSSHRDLSHSYESDAGNPNTVQSLELVYPGPLTIPDTEHVELSGHDQAEEVYGPEEAQGIPQETADPHEISEGVYIDPPPAVLLSLSSPDQYEIFLFNQPPPKSGASSPHTGTSTEQESMRMLLHRRPILYYEPLISVFEALRQEEEIACMPDCAEGEMVIDAHDLRLSISEVCISPFFSHSSRSLYTLQDNIYAREVTLHDLNVLHDGSDFSGPLRLHLRFVVPRFILRYHSLQDQVALQNTAPESAELPYEEKHELKGSHLLPGCRLISLMSHSNADHDGKQHQSAENAGEDETYPQHPEQQWKIPGTEDTDKHEEVIGDISNLTHEQPEHQEPLETNTHPDDQIEFQDTTSDPLHDGDPLASAVASEYSESVDQVVSHPEPEALYDETPPESFTDGQHPTVDDEYPTKLGTLEESTLRLSHDVMAYEDVRSHEVEQSYEDVEADTDQGAHVESCSHPAMIQFISVDYPHNGKGHESEIVEEQPSPHSTLEAVVGQGEDSCSYSFSNLAESPSWINYKIVEQTSRHGNYDVDEFNTDSYINLGHVETG